MTDPTPSGPNVGVLAALLQKLDQCRHSHLLRKREESFAWRLFNHRHWLLERAQRAEDLEQRFVVFVGDQAGKQVLELGAALAAAKETSGEKSKEIARLMYEAEKRPVAHLPSCRKMMYDICSSPCTCQSEHDRLYGELKMKEQELAAAQKRIEQERNLIHDLENTVSDLRAKLAVSEQSKAEVVNRNLELHAKLAPASPDPVAAPPMKTEERSTVERFEEYWSNEEKLLWRFYDDRVLRHGKVFAAEAWKSAVAIRDGKDAEIAEKDRIIAEKDAEITSKDAIIRDVIAAATLNPDRRKAVPLHSAADWVLQCIAEKDREIAAKEKGLDRSKENQE